MTKNKNIFDYLSSQKADAIAKIAGGTNFPKINGEVRFWQLPSGVIVVAEIENLPTTKSNIFAFHIHEGETCEDDFSKTGGHYNPLNYPHPNHSGDLPPLFSNNGEAWQAFFTNRFSVNEIIGKAVIIHEDVDDFTTQPSGNSGEKIACGIVTKSK